MNNTTITDAQIETFRAAAEKQAQALQRASFPTLAPDTLTVDKGSRYVRLVKNSGGDESRRSAYCFIDRTNGDVLKSASWKAPAKHARGNILNPDGGLSAVGAYGANYLR